jgi:hypothetical protein
VDGDELPTDDELLDDDALLEALAVVVGLADEMPGSVTEAARTLHDWSRIDAELAELSAPEVAATRDGGAGLEWRGAGLTVRAEVLGGGWRRRTVEGDVEPLDPPIGPRAGPTVVEAQTADGSVRAVPVDEFGGFSVEVPAGTVRLVVRSGDRALVTPWFTA